MSQKRLTFEMFFDVFGLSHKGAFLKLINGGVDVARNRYAQSRSQEAPQ
jgi:hypothetical protein